MSNDNTQFIDGLIVKAPNERASDYVKAKLSIKRVELIAWLQQQEGDWINADVKVSQSGKWYAAVDNWKPSSQDKPQQRQERAPEPSRDRDHITDGFEDSEIPF